MEAFLCFPAPQSPGLLPDDGSSAGNGVCDAAFPAHPGAFGKCAEPHDELFLPSPGLDLAEPSHMPATPRSCEDLEAMSLLSYGASSPAAHQHGSSCSEALFASCSQEPMQADIPQGFVEESGLSCVDDLFPASQNSGHEFPVWDGMYAWSVDSLPSIEAAFLTQEEKDLQHESARRSRDDENASQMFAQWLQSNADHISLSDLRKIKLKTATIERAIRQLGGGKTGLMLFLKFVLMWVQNSRLKPIDEALTLSMEAHQQAYASLASQCRRPSPVNNVPRSFEGHAHSPTSPFLAHLMPSSLCSVWSAEASYEQPPLADDSVSSHGYGRNNRSPLHRTEICCAKNGFPCQAAGLYPGPNLSPSRYTNHIGLHTGFEKDMTSTMLLSEQQCCCLANPAATTRAARRSRMERQRWSVRRHRRCSASAHQSHHRPSPTASGWSQVTQNGSPSFVHAGGRRDHQQRMGERSILMFPSDYRRPERNLRLLFQKELKQSDVGSLGRIVLPKREAETFLPPLELRDGLNLLVEDMNSSKVWNMRYRFWPNNKSRMYLLENTGDFVKFYDLKEGDFMILFCKPDSGDFVIRGAKGPGQAASLSDKEDDLPISCKEAKSWSPPQERLIAL